MSSPASERPRLRLDTELVHGGVMRTPFGETSEALFLTSGYVYDSAEQAEARFKNEEPGFVYSRFANPTVAMFEERMARLEGAEVAKATATGMAAVTAAILCSLRAGDHVVAASALFGSCRYIVETLCPRFGIAATLVDGTDLGAWAAAVRPETRLFFLESPTNPTVDVLDIPGVAAIAKQAGARLIVDNVFATALLQSPLELGADVVVYSATKHIDGQGRCLGGVILSDEAFVKEHLSDFLRQTGPALSPFNAWVLLKALETFSLRVERQSATAARIAARLEAHPKVARVLYPGLASHPQAALVARQMRSGGSLLAFEVEGGKAGAFAFSNALRVIKISNNLGDSKSLITHPSTTTHQRLSLDVQASVGIRPGLLRLSIGLEDPADLGDDIDAALARL